MRDYAKKYSGVLGRHQKIAGRRPGGSEQGRPFKIIGMVAVAAMLVGVVGSLCFGVALQDELNKLSKGKGEKIELFATHAALSAERDALLQQEKIEAAAGRLGLFPPSPKQLRRP